MLGEQAGRCVRFVRVLQDDPGPAREGGQRAVESEHAAQGERAQHRVVLAQVEPGGGRPGVVHAARLVVCGELR
jgi:hypothetical protein